MDSDPTLVQPGDSSEEPESSSSPIQLGEPFDETYRPVRLLGAGGMGIVYLAEVDLEKFDLALLVAHREKGRGDTREDQEDRRRTRLTKWRKRDRAMLMEIVREKGIAFPESGLAALKILTKPRVIHRFEAEWKGLLVVGHPNVIAVYGGGVASGYPYYSMEYVPDPLDFEALHRQLTISEKIQVVADAARGLAALHDRGIIHRDVKVSNLLVSRGQRGLVTRVSDLGLGKDTLRSDAFTATREVMGTPNYMSPEQLRASREVDPRSDVYSLGGVLYAILAGRPPYQGLAVLEIARRVLAGESPEPVRQFTPGLGEDVERLVNEMMAPDSSGRPGSMHEVAGRLDEMVLRSNRETIVPVGSAAENTAVEPAASRADPERVATGITTASRGARRTRAASSPRTTGGLTIGLALLVGTGAIAWAILDSIASIDSLDRAPDRLEDSHWPSAPPEWLSRSALATGEGPASGAESARDVARTEIREAIRLARKIGLEERHFKRSLEELGFLETLARGAGLGEEHGRATAEILQAERVAFEEWDLEMDLATNAGALEAALARRALFPESRSSEIEAHLRRLEALRAQGPVGGDPSPPAGFPDPADRAILARVEELLLARKYRQAREALRPLERRLDLANVAEGVGWLARFQDLVEAGGGASETPGSATPGLAERIQFARQAQSGENDRTLAILWAMAQEDDEGLLAAYLEARARGLDVDAIQSVARRHAHRRFEGLRLAARTAPKEPERFLARVETFTRGLAGAPELSGTYAAVVEAWARAADALATRPSNPLPGSFNHVFAYGSGARRRQATVADRRGAAALLHDLDERTIYEGGSSKERIWIRFDEPVQVTALQVKPSGARHAFRLYAGDLEEAAAPEKDLLASGVADPAKGEISYVPPDSRKRMRTYTLAVESESGRAVSLAEIYLHGDQRIETVAASVPEWPVRLLPGSSTLASAAARLAFEPDLALVAGDTFVFRWESDAWDVAVVDRQGRVTAVGPGTARIAAQLGAHATSPAIVEVSPWTSEKR